MNYFINLHYLKVSKPAGYSQEKVKKIIAETKKDNVTSDRGELHRERLSQTVTLRPIRLLMAKSLTLSI